MTLPSSSSPLDSLLPFRASLYVSVSGWGRSEKGVPCRLVSLLKCSKSLLEPRLEPPELACLLEEAVRGGCKDEGPPAGDTAVSGMDEEFGGGLGMQTVGF